jgi:hypothetical protein
VREIDTTSKKTVWIYGERRDQGFGDLWDRLGTPVRAFRYGIQENGGGLTVIVDERARILCVNRDKELVWELGGASGNNLMTTTPYLMLPTYISATKTGGLLVTDWGRNMVYEIDPFCIPQRTEKEGYLFRDYTTTDAFVNGGIMESRGYSDKLVEVYSKHESSAVLWRLLGSHNTRNWQVIGPQRPPLAAGEGAHSVISEPWSYIKAQAKSAQPGSPAKVDVFITLNR